MAEIPRLLNYPLHQHPLELTKGIDIYPEHNGEWQCDNCQQQQTNAQHPYHCQTCMYDVCISCAIPKTHARHPDHPLYLISMSKVYPQYNGRWKCDGCEDTKDPAFAYHCFQDQFDICRKCYTGQNLPIHRHPLKPVDAAKLYNNSAGWWACDCCRRHGTDIGSRYSWHCSQCEFDCCVTCLSEVLVPLHNHPLHLTDPLSAYPNHEGGWSCDVCNNEFSATNPEPTRGRPYHCFNSDCTFDVCHNCLAPHVVGDGLDVPNTMPVLRPTPRQPVPHTPHQPPTEILDDDDDASVENLDDSEKCVICVGKRKNATIVHGNTGHVCCCLSCAYTLQRRGDTCPICRAPIDRVIKHFNS